MKNKYQRQERYKTNKDNDFPRRDEYLLLKDYDKDWEHHTYDNPFNGKESFEEVMDALCGTAERNVLNVEDTYAYAYAISTFGKDYFYKRDVMISYTYKDEELRLYGVPNVSWEEL